jgi:hypothetical protein
VAPSACGVANAPVAGPAGRFLDVTTSTPHVTDINWLATTGWATGWTVSCYRTNTTGSHLTPSGNGYTLTPGNNPTGYGLRTDTTYANNNGTVGYTFQPTAHVNRGDAAVWLAKLALADQAVNLAQPTSVATYLAGPYTITNTARAQGPDQQWGTPDDTTIVTIPVDHPLYQPFTDITPTYSSTTDRHGAAILFLANTIVNARFDADGNLIAGQRLADGFPDGNSRAFHPTASTTRQDMAAFIYRIALFDQQTGQHPNLDTTQAKDIPGYSALATAVQWLHATGITTGMPDGTFAGLNPILRQDMAAFLHRAHTTIG